MTSLIATLGAGKGTWTYVQKLIAAHTWDRVFLVTNDFGREKFTAAREIDFILVNESMTEQEMSEKVAQHLRGKVAGFEVAVNFVSGSGREHMALISGILKNGLALRLVGVDDKGIVEL